MFEKLSRRLTIWLIRKKVICSKDKEIYQYGINRFCNIVLVYTTTLVLGIVFNLLYQSILFLMSFIMLRSFAGGYHASTSIKCYFLTIVTVTSFLLVDKFVVIYKFIWVGLLIMFGIIILVLSPIGTSNKPLDEIERIIYKKKTIIVWFLEFSVALIFMFFNLCDFHISIVFSHFITSLALLSEKIRNQHY